MVERYLITRKQTSLAPYLMTKLLLKKTDFINLINLMPTHLQPHQIQQIKTADILAVTSGYALTCVQPFLAKQAQKPTLAVISARLQQQALRQGFTDILVSPSEQQDALLQMLKTKPYRAKRVLWLRGDLSDRYHDLKTLPKNWQRLVVYQNQITYAQTQRLAYLLRTQTYTKILVTSNSAFERIIAVAPQTTATFVTMSYKSARFIKQRGYAAQATTQKQQRLMAAIELLLDRNTIDGIS